MKPTFLAVRSIGAEFANRLFVPVAIVCGGIAVVLIAIPLFLMQFNHYWLLLLIPIIIVVCAGLAVFTVIKLTIRTVAPTQTRSQKQAARQLVDKLQRLTEVTGTPKIVLLFRVVRDIAAPRSNGYIATLATDATSLKRDFMDFQKSFK